MDTWRRKGHLRPVLHWIRPALPQVHVTLKVRPRPQKWSRAENAVFHSRMRQAVGKETRLYPLVGDRGKENSILLGLLHARGTRPMPIDFFKDATHSCRPECEPGPIPHSSPRANGVLFLNPASESKIIVPFRVLKCQQKITSAHSQDWRLRERPLPRRLGNSTVAMDLEQLHSDCWRSQRWILGGSIPSVLGMAEPLADRLGQISHSKSSQNS